MIKKAEKFVVLSQRNFIPSKFIFDREDIYKINPMLNYSDDMHVYFQYDLLSAWPKPDFGW